MSGDKLRRRSAGSSADDFLTPFVGDADQPRDESEDPPSLDPDVPPLDDVTVDEGLVTESLDEILLALIGSAAEETHGTGLMDELERRFDAQLSPGTVYPRLHDLESEDLLEMHELVQTKQYSVTDSAAAREHIERAMREHLALAAFLHASLDAM